MQFDLSAVETGTLVFIGTLMVALALVLFVAVAAFAALVLVGMGRLAWLAVAAALLRTVTGSTMRGTAWCTTPPQSSFPRSFRGSRPLAPEPTRG
jgi:hypothetical protein